MTVNTVRNVTMVVGMTEITSEGRVLTWAGNHLLVGTGMTRDTNRLMLTLKGDIQRLVRIVATEARYFNFVVRTAFMTITAIGDIVFNTRAMPFVASLTINLCLVRGSIRSDLSWLLTMTLATVING